MYCKNCGSALTETAGFCPYCGIRLTAESVSAKVPTVAQDAVCQPSFVAKSSTKTKLSGRAIWALLLSLIPLFGAGFALATLASAKIRNDSRNRRIAGIACIIAGIVSAVACVLVGYFLPSYIMF